MLFALLADVAYIRGRGLFQNIVSNDSDSDGSDSYSVTYCRSVGEGFCVL